jgi:shikimate dehydrogenase
MTGMPFAEVIGDPIAHSKSPRIHGFWLGKLGIAADYRATQVTADGIRAYIEERRALEAWRGCNVTIPHKERIAPLLDRRDSRAERVGAVNTVYREAGGLAGTNTDIDGITEAVGSVDRLEVLVLGTGGAARAAFALLAEHSPARVRVLARTPVKAKETAASCGLEVDALPFQASTGAFEGADLLINATQLGMRGQEPMPRFVLDELTRAKATALVFDMVYAPLETALLARARELRLRTADGLVMLVGQAASAFERFFGQPAPREHDRELRALLTA